MLSSPIPENEEHLSKGERPVAAAHLAAVGGVYGQGRLEALREALGCADIFGLAVLMSWRYPESSAQPSGRHNAEYVCGVRAT